MFIYALFQNGLPIAARIFIIYLAVFCFWTGWFGRRNKYSNIQEDISDHVERKERYATAKSRYEPIENRIEPKDKVK